MARHVKAARRTPSDGILARLADEHADEVADFLEADARRDSVGIMQAV
jgi:hypothetical protein